MTITIFIDVEADVSFDRQVIGLTFATSADEVPTAEYLPPLKAIMLPFEWRHPEKEDKFQVTFPRLPQKFTKLSDTACAHEDGILEIQNFLTSKLDEFLANDGKVIGGTDGQVYSIAPPPLDEDDTDPVANLLPWGAVLADAVSLPGAIGRVLGLSAAISVNPNSRDLTRLMLCPEFAIEWGESNARKRVQLSPPEKTSDRSIRLQVTGDFANEFNEVFEVRCRVRLPEEWRGPNQTQANDAFLDTRTGWIKLRRNAEIGTRDWFAEFPVDVARALDPAAVFLGSADSVLTNALAARRGETNNQGSGRQQPAIPGIRDTDTSTADQTRAAPRTNRQSNTTSISDGGDGSPNASEEEEVPADLLAKLLSLVFVRCLAPRFALGVPNLKQTLTSEDDVSGDNLADRLRKSLLFDIEPDALFALFDVEESGNGSSEPDVLIDAATALDPMFAPGRSSDLANLLRVVKEQNQVSSVTSSERDETSRLLDDLARIIDAGTGGTLEKEAEDSEKGRVEVALERALVRVRRLSGLLDLISEPRLFRPILAELIPQDDDPNLTALRNATVVWARDVGGTDGGESAGFLRVMMDRLRAFNEGPLNAIPSFDDPPALLPRSSSNARAATSVALLRERTMQMGVLAYNRAWAPAIDDLTAEFQFDTLQAVADDMQARLETRVSAHIGPGLGSVNVGSVRLEAPVIAERPEPLSVTVGQISVAANAVTNRLAGFGVLVRRNEGDRGDKRWHSLTLGSPAIVSPASGNELPKPIGAGHYPITVVEQSSLESWLMVFDGLPLTAISVRENPVAGPSLESSGRAGGSDASLDRITVLQIDEEALTDAHDASPTNDTSELRIDAEQKQLLDEEWRRCLSDTNIFKLMTLKNGETLEFAFFAEQNCGFFPIGVSDPDDPALFRLPKVDEPWKATPSNRRFRAIPSRFDHSIRIRLLRRTPVAPPRLVGEFDKTGENAPPSDRAFSRKFLAFKPTTIDRTTVSPLADLLIGNPTRQIDPGSSVDGKRTRNDLIMLAPDNTAVWDRNLVRAQAEIFILPPAATVTDFERWRYRDLTIAQNSGDDALAADLTREIVMTLEARDAMIAEIIRRTPTPDTQTRRDNVPEPAGNDVMPDDPAVEAIGFRLVEVQPRPGGYQASSDVVRVICVELERPVPQNSTGKKQDAEVLLPPLKLSILAVPNLSVGQSDEVAHIKASEITIEVLEGRIYQLDVISLVKDFYYEAPGDPASRCRFRGLPGALAPSILDAQDEKRMAERATAAKAAQTGMFPSYVEASRTTLDIEVTTDRLPSWQEVFNTIEILGQDNGECLVGVLPPEPDDTFSDSAFRYVSDVTVARQRWRWTGRSRTIAPQDVPQSLGMSGDGDESPPDRPTDIRSDTQKVWEASVAASEADRPPGLRVEGRAVLEPDVAVEDSDVEREDLGRLWEKLAGYDGEWFAAITDAERFDENGLWPYFAPPSNQFGDDEASARRARGRVLARIPLTVRPQAQYWRFAAVVRSRYWGLRTTTIISAGRNIEPRERGTPWRRMIVGPDLFSEPVRIRPDVLPNSGDDEGDVKVPDEAAAARLPAPRLRVMIPLPAPLSDTPDSGEWMSFLAVFDETFGEVAGLAEWLRAEVALTSETDEDITASSGALTAVFSPVYDIPEFGFDPILRRDPISTHTDWPRSKPPSGTTKRMLWSDAEPIGLTFDNNLAAVPAKTLVEVRVKVNDDWLGNGMPSPLAGAAGDRLFAEIYFRREVKNWATPSASAKSIFSLRTRLEWVLFGASNETWRIVRHGDSATSANWIHVSALRFNSATNHFHLVTPDGQQHGTVSLQATNATNTLAEPRDGAEASTSTMLVRRVFVVLTEQTRGASGTQRSEVFLAAGFIHEPALDEDPPEGSDPRVPFFWSTRAYKGRAVRARLVEVEFHKKHRVYREMGVRVNGILKRFMTTVDFGTGVDDNGTRDHPLFDVILGGGPDDNREFRDAAGRITRISPPIEPLVTAPEAL